MKNLFWIDSLEGYPPGMAEPIRVSIDTYDSLYKRYAESLGYRFRFVHSEDLFVASGNGVVLEHRELGDLLAEEAAAYVGLIHPDLAKAKKHETIYSLVASAGRMRLLNYTPTFPMVCKDKFRGVHIAREQGLRVLPTVLLGGEADVSSEVAFAERVVGAYPMFVRPRDLTAGLGKKTVNDRAGLRKYLENPPFPGRLHIAQPCVPVDAEYRVYLDGCDVLACRRREPLESGVAWVTPEAIRGGSQALAKHLKTTYLCVDWLQSGSDFWFCELETGGGFAELGEPYRSRVAAAFFRKLVA